MNSLIIISKDEDYWEILKAMVSLYFFFFFFFVTKIYAFLKSNLAAEDDNLGKNLIG